MAESSTALRPMLSQRQVLAIVPLSRSTLMRMSRRGDFPQAYKLSAGRFGWYRDEVEAWQANLTGAVLNKMARMASRRPRHKSPPLVPD